MSPDPTPADDALPTIDRASEASARAVMPRVIGLTGARSVVDVGCGTGAWSRACRDLGVPQVVSVDGVRQPDQPVPGTELVERDLAEPLELGRSFGLALCVDVAEHLPPERAAGLVADLTGLAPVVLFAAAIPGQTGDEHANEQWSEHWVALFDAEGWTCRDAIRPWVRANADVAWWLRQSLFLAVAPSVEQAYRSFPRLGAFRPEHPVDYLVRPPGDVIVPPAPPVPEPQLEAEPEPDAGEGEAPPGPGHEPDEAVPPSAAGPESGDEHDVGAAPAPVNGVGGPAETGTDEELSFPQPPGWAALRRVAGRARRRSGG